MSWIFVIGFAIIIIIFLVIYYKITQPYILDFPPIPNCFASGKQYCKSKYENECYHCEYREECEYCFCRNKKED